MVKKAESDSEHNLKSLIPLQKKEIKKKNQPKCQKIKSFFGEWQKTFFDFWLKLAVFYDLFSINSGFYCCKKG